MPIKLTLAKVNLLEMNKAKRSRERQEWAEEKALRVKAKKVARKRKKVVKLATSWKNREAPKYHNNMKSDFYATREWREVRWKVLQKSDGRCTMCGMGRKDGAVLHVDHIKPRSKYKYLELEISNLQVLCADCNIGKGASVSL